MLDRNTWNHLTVCKKWSQAHSKNVSKSVYKSYIFNGYV